MTKNISFNNSNKIIGIGNAIMDFSCNIEDNFFHKNTFVKGSMSLIEKSDLESFKNLKIENFSSGGSVANTISTLSLLGNECFFIGSVSNDHCGQQYIKDIQENGVKFVGQVINKNDSASSFILISPDGERTMLSYLGCAPIINESDIPDAIFQNAKILYIEGYLWDSDCAVNAIIKAIKIAKKYQCKIAFSLSDAFCVKRHLTNFSKLIENEIDILFGNESEILELTNSNQYSSHKIIEYISSIKRNIIVAITRGEKGCEVFNQNSVIKVSTKYVKPIDTTGAGDNFACGFLHSYLKNYSLQECANNGNLMAKSIIQKMGSRLNKQEISVFKI